MLRSLTQIKGTIWCSKQKTVSLVSLLVELKVFLLEDNFYVIGGSCKCSKIFNGPKYYTKKVSGKIMINPICVVQRDLIMPFIPKLWFLESHLLKKNLFGEKHSLLGSTVQIQIIQINIYLRYENICEQTWQQTTLVSPAQLRPIRRWCWLLWYRNKVKGNIEGINKVRSN